MHIDRIADNGTYEYLVWDDNFSRVIASARLREREGNIEIEMINVDRGFRGEGIGSTLLSRIVSDFERSTLTAWVFEQRVRWYERNGFKIISKEGGLVKVIIEC
jgi:ribosomal protein S18 acetylase RimI-like enzyme